MSSAVHELGLSADSWGFIRRQCPHCRRHFKTRPRPFDGRVVLRALGANVLLENGAEVAATGCEQLYCFYCGKAAAADAWLTAEQRSFLETVATSLSEHLRYEQLSQVIRTLRDNPRPTFVPVRPPPLPPAMAQDVGDMRPFPLPCCSEEVKGAAGWDEPFHCPACGTRQAWGVARQPRLTFVRE